MNDERLRQHVAEHPFPLMFATISGAHLYGFPSEDSDFDLRGAHILPLDDVIGLKSARETIEKSGLNDGMELDLVTHDIKKFMALLLKKNGYVLEQVLSPLIVHTSAEHEELKAIASQCVTRHHAHHYLGFAASQWKLFRKEERPRVKPLLYVYRVLLTGIHLMRTGQVEANLNVLNHEFNLPYLPELLDAKINGAEKQELDHADIEFHEREFDRLTKQLEDARAASRLPDRPVGTNALNDLLVRVRKHVTTVA